MASNRTIEEVRQYWNSRPCNIRHSIKEIGTKDYFEEVKDRKYFVEPHILDFAEFDKWHGKKVLEIGCGLGTETINFAMAGAFVTAVDISEESIAIARKRAEVYGVKDRVVFYHGNAEQLLDIIPVQVYDLIWAFGSIHHSPYPEKIISGIKHYMDSSSELRMMVYHKMSWKVLWILLKYGKGRFWKINELVARYSEAQTGCPVTYYYTKKSVLELLKGFSVQVSFDHIFPYVVSKYINHVYERVWYFKWMPIRWFHWLESRFGWHCLCRCKKLDNSEANK